MTQSKSSSEPFKWLFLSPDLRQVVTELGFEKMTPIQAKSIPLILNGKDIVGQSKTGSGKTAAFALPILQKINLKHKSLQALILCPTRELSAQVAREFRKFGRKHPGLKVIVLSGGEPVRHQLTSLKQGGHIAIGTPGRLKDLIERQRAAWKLLDGAELPAEGSLIAGWPTGPTVIHRMSW